MRLPLQIRQCVARQFGEIWLDPKQLVHRSNLLAARMRDVTCRALKFEHWLIKCDSLTVRTAVGKYLRPFKSSLIVGGAWSGRSYQGLP